MKVNLIVAISILSTLVSCKDKKAKTEENSQKLTFKPMDIPENKRGFWVYEKFFQDLKETKSTKKAQEMGNDEFYIISADNSITFINLHEGAGKSLLIMKNEDTGFVYTSDTTKALHQVIFQNEHMLIDDKEFIWTENIDDGFQKLVNRAFISGKYKLDRLEVEFMEDGELIGIDSLTLFELNLDYWDAGMQFDKIYLKGKNETQPVTYIYKFEKDTLFINEIDCKTYQDDFCVEIENGRTIMKLIKNGW